MGAGLSRPLLLLLLAIATPATALDIQVNAPPSLSSTAEQLRTFDQAPLAAALAAAGLRLPPVVSVTLLAEDGAAARETPRWIVGFAFGTSDVVILPARIGGFPYDSLESVLRHEMVHLALNVGAEGKSLPRWFHEGVAVTAESGWGIGSDVRLVLAAFTMPGLDDLAKLFASDTQLGNSEAYLLAAALVADVQDRHGDAVPGAIAGRVAEGVPFAQAFQMETGESPDTAAARAWANYRRWTTWFPAITDGSAVWIGIIVLALAAFVAQRRRRARRRRQWEEEDKLPGREPRSAPRSAPPSVSSEDRPGTNPRDVH